ncbi:hypothetical protein K1T71_014288 [Dendrolimus kikuchii]|uniref:Uncharacterized protein n=1 Tax=Dendrolimus kikuchii TaxID=765133 RepID=A0ACC1CFH9_9NEOP|nr:hypothetical protein K1T71_014288 [Dendrolimus kikuchii]
MAEEEEAYCRLCAKLTSKIRLISIYEELGIGTKIITKLQWINIDVCTSNNLPTDICYGCWGSLDRTWIFLNEVRAAQIKLNEIYKLKTYSKNETNEKEINLEEAGKPIDMDWETFKDTKAEIKSESEVEKVTDEIGLDENLLDTVSVKFEKYSDNEINDRLSMDSDAPLLLAVKKKKIKKKKKYDTNGTYPNVSWDDFMCRCAKCDAQCMDMMSLRLHSLQIHTRCCMFKCSVCGKVALNYKSFVSHSRHHNKALKTCCEYCNKRFPTSPNLKHHKNTTHLNIDLLMCPTCGALFESEELLQDHLAIYTKGYRKRIPKQKAIDFKCPHCDKQFKSRSNLQQHMLVHTDRNRNFACHICGKMFFTKGTLSTHIMTHEDRKPFKCDICLMGFRAKGNLISHISLHSGLKPFVCEQCGKSFRVKRHLKSHSITHTDLRPYTCEYCQKTFRFKTRLNLHLRQHTGAKPYKCTCCQREFTNGSNYKKHMRRRHNIDTSKKKFNTIVNNIEDAVNQMS